VSEGSAQTDVRQDEADCNRCSRKRKAYLSQNGEKDATEILQDACTLAGSVRKSRHRLRDTAQLNQAATDAQFGLATCDRELDDLISIPGNIAAGIG
jgi:TolB-like protein